MRGALAVLIAALLVATASADPVWTCRVCEDVMQTWHDQFRCSGHFLDWGDPLSPDIRGCEGPMFDCNKLAGKLKNACLSLTQVFQFEPLIARKIWENMMLTNDPYKTCQEIGRCAPDPEPTAPSPCHLDFMDSSCGKNPTCTNFTQDCEESCYLCNWLVRDWPLFQEICKPLGAQLPMSVPLPTDILPNSFIETDSAENHRHRTNVKRPQKKLSNDARVISLQSGYTLTQECFRMWNEIHDSMKARYFASWQQYVGVQNDNIDRLTGNMWDANIGCKCLGRCDLNRFEDLGLMETCRYEAADEKIMRYVFMYEADLHASESSGSSAPAAAPAAALSTL